MPRSLPLLALLVVAPLAPAVAQIIPQPDSATLANSAARSALTYWEASSGGPEEQSVYLKNNSTRAIWIPSYEVYECNNIPHKVCGVHSPGPTIPPGKTITLVTISRVRDNFGWSYRYRYTAQFVPDSTATPRP
jgi:hypothetical protein